MQHLRRLLALAISAAVVATVPSFAGAAKPDLVSYFGRADDGAKLRLATRGHTVTNMVFHAKGMVCRRANGDVAKPWYGKAGVTSGFNDTELRKSGAFVAHDAYKRPPGFVRNLSGDVKTGEATVNIRFMEQTKRDGKYDITCRTGAVEFDLHRVG